MLQYLLYFFAFIGFLSVSSFIVLSCLVRKESRELEQSELEIDDV